MIEVTQLRRNVTFEHDNQLLKVVDYEHRKMGRGGAKIRVKVRNVRTESTYEITFNSGERVQDIRLEKREYQYLYDDGQFFVFMDMETYAQIQVAYAIFGKDSGYLKDNMDVELLSYEDEVLDYKLPMTVELTVTETEGGVAGDTATGATQEVTLETGLVVRTPLFINPGDVLRINTESGEYITRA